MGKKILVTGSGGREHALVKAFLNGSSVDSVICSPGNAGTAKTQNCVNISADSIEDVVALAKRENVDLVVPGPEAPLAEGLVDKLTDAGIPAFGPDLSSARLESSKAFAKDFMKRNGVATAAYKIFEDYQSASASLKSGEFSFPVVVKASGLAAGKGVLICGSLSEALEALDELMIKKNFGSAGSKVVIEEFLEGWETSIIGITDGKTFMPFLPAKDHKRAGNNDTGPNTGGMGVIAPHPLVTDKIMKDIQQNIINPTLNGLESDNLEYAGFLFIGVMVTSEGAKTLEYNVRFGDPEAQALLPLLKGDLYSYIQAAMEGRLSEIKPEWNGGASCCVVIASEGYPGTYKSGYLIEGIENAEKSGCMVYTAGVKLGDNGEFLTSGGRVLGVSAVGKTLEEAVNTAYSGAGKIRFKGSWYRLDIGGEII